MSQSPPESAAQRAYRALEKLIVTLELRPGEVTTEGAMIERLKLGRTPVREAIQRLAWEGLLEVRSRAGLAVAPLHAADWLKVIDARRGVEALLARSAARHLSQDGTRLFRDAALAMQTSVVSGNVFAFLEADKAMDEALAATGENPFAARLAGPLQTHSRRFWFRYKADTGLAESAEHHVEVIRAVLDGDGDNAAQKMDRLLALLRAHAEAAALA